MPTGCCWLSTLPVTSAGPHGPFITPCSTLLIEKPVNKFPVLYVNRRFVTAFTPAHHLSISWTRSIHSVPSQSNSLRPILILSPIYACLTGVDAPKTRIFLLPVRATSSAHLIFLTRIIFALFSDTIILMSFTYGARVTWKTSLNKYHLAGQRITTIQLDGVQYFISRMNPYSPELNYFLAYQYCRSIGLQLASFESKEKADSMTQYLLNAGKYAATAPEYGCTMNRLWL